MAQPDGTLKYDTLIDSNGFKSGLAKISNLAKTALQGAATLLASATAALSAGAMAGVKYNAQMEQYITSFGTMLGSAEKAQNMISQIKKFAAETPFELPDLAKGAQTLLAFGTAEEKVLRICLAMSPKATRKNSMDLLWPLRNVNLLVSSWGRISCR